MPYKDPEKARANQKLRSQRYHERHKEEIRARRQATAPSRQAYFAAYREIHREELRKKNRAYEAEHKEEKRARSKRNAQEHPERIRAYYATNRAKVLERVRQWAIDNPERVRVNKLASVHRRRARKLAAPQNDFTAAQWRAIKEAFHYRCAYCGKKSKQLEQDHITPLAKGGSHTVSNIVPACLPCNRHKSANPPPVPVQPLLLV